MVRKDMRWALGTVVGFLALVGVGASTTHYLQEPYNPGFLEYPAIVALHVVLGGLYLALAPFQFVGKIRSRHLGYHRWTGRLLVAVGLAVGITALFMGMVIPFSGWIERVYIGAFGALFLVAIVKGFIHVRVGRVVLHREWMIRALALGLAVATMRLIFIPALLVVADPTDEQIATLSAASFMAAFVLHASVAEAWIRATRGNLARKSGGWGEAATRRPRAGSSREDLMAEATATKAEPVRAVSRSAALLSFAAALFTIWAERLASPCRLALGL